MQPMQRLRARRHGRGQTLAEFALALPVFLLIMLAVFDVGRAVFTYNTITNAAREGARLAIVNQTEASIDARAMAQAGGIQADPNKVVVSYREPGPNNDPLTNASCSPVTIGCIAVVTFEAQWRAITPFVGNVLGPMTFTARSAQPVEYVCPNAAVVTCPKQP